MHTLFLCEKPVIKIISWTIGGFLIIVIIKFNLISINYALNSESIECTNFLQNDAKYAKYSKVFSITVTHKMQNKQNDAKMVMFA